MDQHTINIVLAGSGIFLIIVALLLMLAMWQHSSALKIITTKLLHTDEELRKLRDRYDNHFHEHHGGLF